MSKADEMFEKLEYSIIEDDGKVILYQKPFIDIWNKPAISFDKVSQLIGLYDIKCLNAKVLQAINKKCQELGWIE